MSRFALPLLALTLAAPFAPAAHATSTPTAPLAVPDTTRLGVPFRRWTTTDRFGRTITFYLSVPRDSLANRALPLVLVIDGSGCQSVWTRVGERLAGSHQNLMLRAARGRARVLIVEKPGVPFAFQPKQPGSAEEGSAEFLREHTLDRWSEANVAALRAALARPGIDRGRVLACGHSEGAGVAARVAALCPEVTHVASLSGGGPTQLFDLAELFGAAQPGDSTGAAAARRQSAYDEWAKIRADSASVTRFWLGHPYRRWASFGAHDLLPDLLATRARVYLAHGTEDRSVPVVAFDVLRAQLAVRGREATVERVEGVDHGFFGPEGAPKDGRPAGVELVFGRVLDWFLAG